MGTGRRKASRSTSDGAAPFARVLLCANRGSGLTSCAAGYPGMAGASDALMIKVSRLLASVLVLAFGAAAVATPSFADGRKRPPPVTAPPPPPLRIPPPAPPIQPEPTPIKAGPHAIVLPSNFGTGGVGIDINGGSGGGGRLIVISGGSARAQTSATAFAYASASATAFAGGGGKGHGGGGGNGCGCK